jgi:hypothetical protein
MLLPSQSESNGLANHVARNGAATGMARGPFETLRGLQCRAHQADIAVNPYGTAARCLHPGADHCVGKDLKAQALAAQSEAPLNGHAVVAEPAPAPEAPARAEAAPLDGDGYYPPVRQTDDILRRVPPQNLEAEQAVLCAILLDNEAIEEAGRQLVAIDFYRESHRTIFAAMQALRADKMAIDAITLSAALDASGKLEGIGGNHYIAELCVATATAANVAYYARIVRDRSLARRLASKATELASLAFDGASADTLAAELKHLMPAVQDSGRLPNLIGSREMPTAASFLSDHRKRVSKPEIVERMLLAGTFNMMLGRPFGGKSSEAAALTLKIHRGGVWLGRKCTKAKVGYFALERSGVGVAELFERWGIAQEVRYEGEIPVADAPAFIERRIREYGLQFVVVDHLQHAARITEGNDYANVSNALAPFQRIAAETGCCILVLHHQRKPQPTDNQSDSSGEIEALGSDAYRAASETLLECSKWRDSYFVRGQTRGLTDLPKARVVIDFETGDVEMGDVREEELDAAAMAIAAHLVTRPGRTEKEIRQAVRGHSARNMTDALRDDKKFRREGDGGRKDPYRYFVLPVPDPLSIQSEQEPEKGTQPLENKGEVLVPNKNDNQPQDSASHPPQNASSCSSLFTSPGTDKSLDISSAYGPNSVVVLDTQMPPQGTGQQNNQNRLEQSEQSKLEGPGLGDEVEI